MKKAKLFFYAPLGIITLLFAGFFSLFASNNPDGLERVAIDAGFMASEQSHWTFSLFPDYEIPALSNNWISKSISGILGVLIMFAFIWIIGKYLTKGSRAIGKI